MTLNTSAPSFNITLIQPENFVHSAALAELAETLMYGLGALNCAVQFNINGMVDDRVNIVLGAHLLDAGTMNAIPPETILYNSEQIDDRSARIMPAYLDLLKKCEVWDYNQENHRRLKERGVHNAKYVPIGYVPQLTRISVGVPQDIDVLFYGSINERRRAILEELIQKGLRVEFLHGVYREERDLYIARSKVILNLHYHDANIFEIVRVSWLLANEKAVVAECGDPTALEADIREAIRAVPYDRLVETCMELVANAEERNKLSRNGLEIFSRRGESEILAQALGLPAPQKYKEIPATLNLGSGWVWRQDCFNVDINENFRPDAVLDIAQSPVEGIILPTIRFGDVVLRENLFDAIVANDVLEHIPNLKTAMSNCLRLLKPGGAFHIRVPYDLSHGAWQDPTHVRAFNENSWGYYTGMYWYMNWTEARFDVLQTTVYATQFGEQLNKEGKTFAEIIRTPRAIDHIDVVLRKRYLLESEIAKASAMLRRPFDDEPNLEPRT
ncbi:MAG: methyltransferase domain-containing protein [Candidatus Accumulibacter sp.]|jgi:SAM-dependent methyltransferase|nr:methyltransferase domain-containing protein [Accumulibacter sp.]